MILSLTALSIIVAFIGLRYLLLAAQATYAHERDEAIDDAVGMGILLAMISTLILALSYVVGMKG